jgi:hypothetical protein
LIDIADPGAVSTVLWTFLKAGRTHVPLLSAFCDSLLSDAQPGPRRIQQLINDQTATANLLWVYSEAYHVTLRRDDMRIGGASLPQSIQEAKTANVTGRERVRGRVAL